MKHGYKTPRNEYSQKYYRSLRERARKRRKNYRQKVTDIKRAHGCTFCLEKEPVSLAFHHLQDKKFNISQKATKISLDELQEELKKCIVVCHNCHAKVHAGLLTQENQRVFD